jgi:hypothetical protein
MGNQTITTTQNLEYLNFIYLINKNKNYENYQWKMERQ